MGLTDTYAHDEGSQDGHDEHVIWTPYSRHLLSRTWLFF
jgi:hypothetical protein